MTLSCLQDTRPAIASPFLSLLFALPALAQSTKAELLGLIRDPVRTPGPRRRRRANQHPHRPHREVFHRRRRHLSIPRPARQRVPPRHFQRRLHPAEARGHSPPRGRPHQPGLRSPNRQCRPNRGSHRRPAPPSIEPRNAQLRRRTARSSHASTWTAATSSRSSRSRPASTCRQANLLPRINGSRPRTSEYIYDGISVLQPEPGQVAFYPDHRRDR